MAVTLIRYRIMLFLGVIMTMAPISLCFLLSSGSCVLPSACHCDNKSNDDVYINCRNSSLKDMPYVAYVASPPDFPRHIDMDFSNNAITSLPDFIFKNFSSVNTSHMYIRLRNNKINNIHPDAFTGVEDKVSSLDLSHNELHNLSTAFRRLTHLQYLKLEGNLLTALESSLMAHLDRSLRHLFIDMSQFLSWPNAVNRLQHLQEIHVYNIPFNDLPVNAFVGMDNLWYLEISYSKLARIPAAICNIHKLKAFVYQNNPTPLNNVPLFEPCSRQLMHLTYVSLRNASLYNFSETLGNLPYLMTLELNNNKIGAMDSSLVPKNIALNRIELSNNHLTTIPFALNKFPNLGAVDLEHNNIARVDDNALPDLVKLFYLNLGYNPIEYIAPNAFKNNVNIRTMGLVSTKLQQVPDAVHSLPQLQNLYFRN